MNRRNNLAKILSHLRNGTLIVRLRSALRGPRSATTQEPVGDVYYGLCAEQYLSKRRKQDYWHLEQKIMEELLKEFPTGISVLDVPFGTGRFVPFYTQMGMKIVGLDASKDMIEVARRELAENFGSCVVKVGDAVALPFKNGEFELCVCFRFLSHIVSYDQAKVVLAELRRVCKKHLIVQLRVRQEAAPKISNVASEQPMGDQVDLRGIAKLLSDAGFRIVKELQLEERKTYRRAVFLCEITQQ